MAAAVVRSGCGDRGGSSSQVPRSTSSTEDGCALVVEKLPVVCVGGAYCTIVDRMGVALRNNHLMVTVRIEGMEVQGCLLDCGSGSTIIRRDVFDRLPTRRAIRSARLKQTSAGGAPMAVIGVTDLHLEVCNVVAYHEVVVVSELVVPVIIGNDLFVGHQGKLEVVMGQPSFELRGLTCEGCLPEALEERVLKRVIVDPPVSAVSVVVADGPSAPVLSTVVSARPVIGPTCSAAARAELEKVLDKHPAVFSRDDLDLGHTGAALHVIDTGDAVPIKQAPRRVPFGKQREELEKQIGDLLKIGVIRKSDSPWASPTVMVTKKDGAVRLCIDYRKLNEVTRKDGYPLPRLDDCVDLVSGRKFFSTLDVQMAYHQVEVAPESMCKTAFCTYLGLYEYTRLPFGLVNAPATFQRMISSVLAELLNRSVLAYLDDVIVYSYTETDHVRHLDEVFTCLENAGLKLKPRKCFLFQNEVKYLGHVLSADGVSVSGERVKSVVEWEVPKTPAALCTFLGFVGFYRRFLDGCGPHLAILREVEKADPYTFGPSAMEAFGAIKSVFQRSSTLAYPDVSKPFVLETDASELAIGAALLQREMGEERAVAFYSRKLSDTERRYSTYKREMLAIRDAVRHFRVYLLAKPFLIRTDHRPLVAIRSKGAGPVTAIAGWVAELGEFDFEIVYRKGAENSVADALSRSVSEAEKTKATPESLVSEFFAVHEAALGGVCAVDDVQVPAEEIGLSSEWAKRQLTDPHITLSRVLLSEIGGRRRRNCGATLSMLEP